MDQQQSYIISLIAVFLALGIGILIGAAMGENTLVTNQIAVIEELNKEIRRHKEEMKAQFLSAVQFKEELLAWDALEKEYLNPLLVKDKLKNVTIKIIVQGDLPTDLVDFLELSGCSYQAFVFTGMEAWPEHLGGGDEDVDVSLLEAGPSLLVADALEQVLLGEDDSFVQDIINNLVAMNLLWIQKKHAVSSLSSPVGNKENNEREFFLACGQLDPLYVRLLHKVAQKGKAVLRVDVQEKQDGITAEPEPPESVVWEKFTLSSFYDKYKLLDFLQAA